MSLLLDALKKAADEKKKKQGLDAVPVPDAVRQEEELDLDLEINDVDFPQVDEAAMHEPDGVTEEEVVDKQGYVEAPLDEIKDKDNEPAIVADDGLLQMDEEQEAAPGLSSDTTYEDEQEVDKAEKEEDTPPVVSQPATEKISAMVRDRTDTYLKEQKKDALKLLITDANRATKMGQRRNIIYLAVILLALFVTTATYIFLFKNNYEQRLAMPVSMQNDSKELASLKGNEQPVVIRQEVAAVEKLEEKPLVKPAVKKQATEKTAAYKKAPGKISVVRKSEVNPVDALLNKAYSEFNAGNYNEAKKLYLEVMGHEPRNRDGLLGLAAVAVKQANYDYAAQKYASLLRLDPKDTYARAGLSSIESKLNPQKNESLLKMMLSEQPEAAHLHFVLGSIYVGQKRWAEAQASFFNAWSRESTNTDYIFNLAVSLDHLGKTEQALKFYQMCLDQGAGNYPVEQVKTRIKTLKDNKHE